MERPGKRKRDDSLGSAGKCEVARSGEGPEWEQLPDLALAQVMKAWIRQAGNMRQCADARMVSQRWARMFDEEVRVLQPGRPPVSDARASSTRQWAGMERVLVRMRGLAELDLSSCCDIVTARQLGDLALTAPRLTELSLQGCERVGGRGVAQLPALSCLVRLDLSYADLQDAVFASLPRLRLLQHLSLEGNAGLSLPPCERHLHRMPALESLDISSCERLFEAGVPWRALPPSLTALRADGIALESVAVDGRPTQPPPGLRLLSLNDWQAPGSLHALAGSVPELSQLTQLSLQRHHGLDGTFLPALMRLTQLQELLISSCELDAPGVVQLARRMPHLLRLDLSHWPAPLPHSVPALIAQHCRRLTSLDLSGSVLAAACSGGSCGGSGGGSGGGGCGCAAAAADRTLAQLPPSLTQLNLNLTGLSAAPVAPLLHLTELRSLTLRSSPRMAPFEQHLLRLPLLQHVHVCLDHQAYLPCLQQLTQHPSLTSVALSEWAPERLLPRAPAKLPCPADDRTLPPPSCEPVPAAAPRPPPEAAVAGCVSEASAEGASAEEELQRNLQSLRRSRIQRLQLTLSVVTDSVLEGLRDVGSLRIIDLQRSSVVAASGFLALRSCGGLGVLNLEGCTFASAVETEAESALSSLLAAKPHLRILI